MWQVSPAITGKPGFYDVISHFSLSIDELNFQKDNIIIIVVVGIADTIKHKSQEFILISLSQQWDSNNIEAHYSTVRLVVP